MTEAEAESKTSTDDIHINDDKNHKINKGQCK